MDSIEFRSLKKENLMGEARKDAYRFNPDASGLKVEFHGTKVTSDAG